MGAFYYVTKVRSANNTANDQVTIIGASTVALKIWGCQIIGGDTASAANEVLISKSTGGTTPGAAITPQPTSGKFAAATFTTATTWAAQPTLGVTYRRLAVNGNGQVAGQARWVQGMEIDVPPSGQVSVRPSSGSSNVTIELLVEEIA